MKKSRFIYTFEEDGFTYWYNTFTDKAFKLNSELSEKVRELLDDLQSFKELVPSLYQKFIDAGYINEDNVDEHEIIKNQFNALIDSDTAFIVILPTINCNYKCWYCVQSHVPTIMSTEVMEKVKKHILYLLDEKKIKHLQIDWFGGEPLMYFKQVVVPISEFAKTECEKREVGFKNGATTNGYFLKPEIFDDLERLDFQTFQITLDGNRENHDKVKFQKGLVSAFDHVLTNINALLHKSEQFDIALRINYTHDNITTEIVDQVSVLISEDVRSRVRIMPYKVWQERVDKNFNTIISVIQEKFKNNGFKVDRWRPEYRMSCYTQHKHFKAINYNGDLVKCTASNNLHVKEAADGMLTSEGNAIWKDGVESKYQIPTFENHRCLQCVFLPACGGVCPRTYNAESSFCKYDGIDDNIENLIRDYVMTTILTL